MKLAILSLNTSKTSPELTIEKMAINWKNNFFGAFIPIRSSKRAPQRSKKVEKINDNSDELTSNNFSPFISLYNNKKINIEYYTNTPNL